MYEEAHDIERPSYHINTDGFPSVRFIANAGLAVDLCGNNAPRVVNTTLFLVLGTIELTSWMIVLGSGTATDSYVEGSF